MANCRSARIGRVAAAGAVISLAAVILAGCAAAGSHQASPNDPKAEVRPEPVEITPSSARPGENIEVRFPDGSERGLGWALEEKGDHGWHVRYYLTSQPKQLRGQAAPSWRPVEGDEPGWDAIGVSGEGPDLLTIPDTAAPGEYRLCTVSVTSKFCVAVDIVQ